MPTMLVLGGETGLLGQAIVAKMKTDPSFSIATLGRTDGDITSESFFSRKIDEIEPDVVFNTIAWTQVDDAEDHPEEAYRMNATFPEMVARVLKKTGAHLVHFSTDFVFGGAGSVPYTEEDLPAPASVYGRTKLEGEKKIEALLPHQSVILRCAWLYGPWKKNFVKTILNAAKKRPSLSVVNDQIGSPTFTPDLADWALALASKRQTGIWHAVNGGSASWYELAKTALEMADISCLITPITSDEWPQKAQRPSYSVLNCDKLGLFLGCKPRNWQDALRDYFDRFYPYERETL